MPSFAHWKYRKILEADGGPLSRISSRRVPSTHSNRQYEAFATVRDDLRPRPKSGLYGTADGTGSGETEVTAVHRAISEALERWAFHATQTGPDARLHGFDVNPTTTGMAAYPGLTARSPRQVALREAIERWSVCAWWEGVLPTRREAALDSGPEVIHILSPWPEFPVVLLASSAAADPPFCYGFACGRSLSDATSHALVEWERNRETLLKYATQGTTPVTLEEERLLLFSTPEGRQRFQERLSESEHRQTLPEPPRLIVDGPVPGPWSRYAHVWRCLFEWSYGDSFLKAREYFLF